VYVYVNGSMKRKWSIEYRKTRSGVAVYGNIPLSIALNLMSHNLLPIMTIAWHSSATEQGDGGEA
jgi:hypothetical protein